MNFPKSSKRPLTLLIFEREKCSRFWGHVDVCAFIRFRGDCRVHFCPFLNSVKTALDRVVVQETHYEEVRRHITHTFTSFFRALWRVQQGVGGAGDTVRGGGASFVWLWSRAAENLICLRSICQTPDTAGQCPPGPCPHPPKPPKSQSLSKMGHLPTSPPLLLFIVKSQVEWVCKNVELHIFIDWPPHHADDNFCFQAVASDILQADASCALQAEGALLQLEQRVKRTLRNTSAC